jgi:hypothetical protein
LDAFGLASIRDPAATPAQVIEMSAQTAIQHQPLRALPAGVSALVKAVARLIRNLRLIAREFDSPLRALLVGLTVNGIELDVDELRLLKPLDGAFRNQCLALLIAVPGFNVKKAIELLPLDEPLRTHGLVLLASTPTLDVETLFELYNLKEPFRSQCVAWMIKDPAFGVKKVRLLEQCHESVQRQALALVAGAPTFEAADAARLEMFTHYRPTAPGHADVFFRDAFERTYDDEIHLRAALEWLLHSHDVTGDGGFAAAYSFKDGWLPPYPETTGYIIPTLFDAHAVLADARLRAAAVQAAEWEAAIQLTSGAIQAGYWGADPQQFWSEAPVPAAFNTGQVVLGWNRAYQETGERRFLDASVRACRFLVECVGEDGVFRRGLSPGPTNPTRAYYTRVAYAMAWTGRLIGDASFETTARRHLDWVVRQLQPDGWFLHAGFQDDDMPLTHTMAYTAEGLLDAGALLEERRYVEASHRHVVAAAEACEERGLFLPAHFTSGWKSADRFSCVPGNAQFATLWCRHGRRTGNLSLINTGLKMVEWLKKRQSLDNVEAGIRGGLPGAWPIDGGYSVYSYVNWATKYFVDALLEARAAQRVLANVE